MIPNRPSRPIPSSSPFLPVPRVDDTPAGDPEETRGPEPEPEEDTDGES